MRVGPLFAPPAGGGYVIGQQRGGVLYRAHLAIDWDLIRARDASGCADSPREFMENPRGRKTTEEQIESQTRPVLLVHKSPD